jgi:hypothetical protein
MTPAPATATELAELRKRLQAALLDSSRPMPARMEEFRRLLRESQICAASSEANWQSLEDSY